METIAGYAQKAIVQFGHKVAVKDRFRSFTYTQLGERAYKLVTILRNMGMKKGDRLAALMSNRIEHIELDLACAFGGFIKVPLNYRLHPKEHEYMLKQSGTKIVIGEDKLLDQIESGIRKISVGNQYEGLLAETEKVVITEQINEDDVFAIMYTSGTTGKPKGVMLTHRNIISSAISLSMACEITWGDVIGHVAPLTHGSNFLSHASWIFGLTQIVYDKFDPEDFLEDIYKDKVSVIFLVPTIVNLLFQSSTFDPKKLQYVKTINMAGSPIASSKLSAALSQAGDIFVETYGQVEAPMTITVMPRKELENHLESCGLAGAFVDMKIVDEAGNTVDQGKIGEIICKGSLVMKGYWDNPEATSETLKDGWLYTGDLGWADKNGFLHLVDRKKEVIISGGLNIYPREIEEVLNKHSSVKETCVIGLPCEQWGEKIAAYVVLKDGETADEEELINLCMQHLASFKKPKVIQILDQLPKSSYGKILKREVKQLYGGVNA
ncbi:class I adenylate-forming enzyme family protein [Peribacillus frigoritolerans]|uniref:class I adenylate-forming enzyme family protein n=1 Tax=Peribacillus frigoritolerans TaxID=450367 RepID=UPI001059AAF4|nr:AMP-binding protein [Peribacillus frigoritolerans]TDL83167.1 long-chain fatty acid--CoA ligase [Peribacillus frigoritolerans]